MPKTYVILYFIFLFFQNQLWNERKVLLFKLITGSDEFAIVLTEDFVSHVRKKVKPENINVLGITVGNICF